MFDEIVSLILSLNRLNFFDDYEYGLEIQIHLGSSLIENTSTKQKLVSSWTLTKPVQLFYVIYVRKNVSVGF